MLFGSKEYTSAIDIWSLGCVMSELAGNRFMSAWQEHGPTEDGTIRAIFQQLGFPTGNVFTGLPQWPGKGFTPKAKRENWPHRMASALGVQGLELLDEMLSYGASQRPTAEEVARHPFLLPESFPVQPASGMLGPPLPGPAARFVGSPGPCYQGRRHAWNLCTGSLAGEVLEWLRSDEALQPGSDALAALKVSFQAKRADAKSEEGRKFIMSGAMEGCASSSMCALSLKAMLPLPRFRAWRLALLAVNRDALAAMAASARVALQRLSAEERGLNGADFLKFEVHEWFASCGELVFVEPGDVERGFWAEPEHQDGGGSVMHLGVTLFGRRELVCRQGLGLPDVKVHNAPGTVYVGQLTGPVHQVTHQASRPRELLEVPGLGYCGVNVMLRTALFAHNRARLRDTTPSPQVVFEALARCFREGLAGQPLRLPTLSECQARFTI